MKTLIKHWSTALAAVALSLAVTACGFWKSSETPSGTETGVQEEQPAGDQPEAQSPAPRAESRESTRPAPRAQAPRPKPAQETARTTVPSGTALHLSLETDLATNVNVAGDRFEATVTEPVVVDRTQVIPAGSVVQGVLTQVTPAKKLSGGASMTLEFKEIRLPSGYRTSLAASLTTQGAKTGKKSGAIIGGSAAGGAVLGKIIGHDTKDAVIGSVIGGAIGAGVAASKDKDVRIPAGTALTVMTEQPLQIPVKVKVEG